MHDLQEPVVSHRARSPQETLQYATRLAQALRRMHEDGVVCGHLHPSQIALEDDVLTVNRNGDGGGVTPYTAPELLHGNPPDARSDVFAFGAMVYEFLSGRRAFPADDPEEMKTQILHHDPIPLEASADGIPRLLRRCLEKKPEHRWQRMASILIELKLASATRRSTQQLSEWKERIAALQNQITDLDGRLAAHQSSHEGTAIELRQSLHEVDAKSDQNASQIARVAESVASVQESVAVAQKMSHAQSLTIESIHTGLSQTDEVLEHMVDALGLIHKSMVDRAETNVLAASPSGN